MSNYWHSVILQHNFCNGCTYCLDRCPTQAIRVKDGKAQIIPERCIDCGECLKVCPYHAKGALSDSLDMLKNYKFNIALPAISLYGQFPIDHDINKVFNGLYDFGFDYIYDVAYAADILTTYQLEKIERNKGPKPLISTYCPVITRLIQIKYPSLIENIIRVESPVEVSARIAKSKIMEMTGLDESDIGVFYITQCPATITAIKNPIGIEESCIDGAISIESIYTKLLKRYDDIEIKTQVQKATGRGIGWGMVGGQSFAMGLENYLAVDGVEEVIKVLDKIDLGKLSEIDFFEGYACVTGCVGGPLNVENPFIAKNRIRQLSSRYLDHVVEDPDSYSDEILEWHNTIEPKPVLKLDVDMKQAIMKMGRIEEITRLLPGIDCGACGAPTCRALAEDIVLGRASLDDCVVKKVKDNQYK